MLRFTGGLVVKKASVVSIRFLLSYPETDFDSKGSQRVATQGYVVTPELISKEQSSEECCGQ